MIITMEIIVIPDQIITMQWFLIMAIHYNAIAMHDGNDGNARWQYIAMHILQWQCMMAIL